MYFYGVLLRGHRHTRLLMAVGMGGSQLCLRRFHGVRRVALSADDAEVGVVIHAGLGGNRQPQRGGFHSHIIRCFLHLVGLTRRIILQIPLIGQPVALQAFCRDREGDPVMFAEQQAVFRLFLLLSPSRAVPALPMGKRNAASASVRAALPACEDGSRRFLVMKRFGKQALWLT